MDPVSIIVGALIAGATDAVKETAGQAVKDAYAGLKGALGRVLTSHALPLLERRPESEDFKAALVDELTESGAGSNGTLIELSQCLLDAIEREGNASEGSRVIIRTIRAARLKIGDITAGEGGTVAIEEINGTESAEIGTIRAGRPPGK